MEPRPVRDPEARRKMEAALDLADFAEEVMRQNLRRRHPDADDEGIERLLVEWLHTRPGAEHGDGVGRPVPWPRSRE
jgi:Rv0078B-related antitoxin